MTALVDLEIYLSQKEKGSHSYWKRTSESGESTLRYLSDDGVDWENNRMATHYMLRIDG